MFSLNQIERLMEVGAYQRLIDRILANGRCDVLEARRRLGEGGNARLAALGLALQRCCELTYGPTEIGRQLAGELRLALLTGDNTLSMQPGAGALAVAARGLLDWIARLAQLDETDSDASIEHTAVTRCLSLIGAAQDRSGLIGNDAAESAIVLWQLGEHAHDEVAISPHVDLMRLRTAVMRSTDRADGALCRFAYAVAA